MKALSLCAVLLFSIFNTQFLIAQKTTAATADIKVWGNCESCKHRIETAAKKAGAITASWNEESKNLAVTFDGTKTTTDKIEAAIAAKGHDTQHLYATDNSYNKLPGCCQYDRKQTLTKEGMPNVKKCCKKSATGCSKVKS